MTGPIPNTGQRPVRTKEENEVLEHFAGVVSTLFFHLNNIFILKKLKIMNLF